MAVSMKKMSAGDGYRYFMETVATGDVDRLMSTPLTRYYAETGTPPGRWLGGGVAALGSDAAGRLAVGDIVTEPQMARLAGKGLDPVTGGKLGRAYPDYGAGSDRKAVAGYDFTFSLPKSASILWAVADAGLQEVIVDVHHAGVGEVFAFVERELAATRVGASVAGSAVRAAGEGGAVAQVPVTGLIAMAFDHPDSRANDPHLHTHVVVSNKVQAVLDGRWRSLDGRGLHEATVALSELHEAILADRLTRALGLEWEPRSRGKDRNPAWAIKGVPDEVVEAFSNRSAQIDARTDELIAEHRAKYGRAPTRKQIVKYRGQANLEARPAKVQRSLADLTAAWRQRAAALLGRDPAAWARQVASGGGRVRLLRADDVPQDVIADVAATVLIAVGEKRSTWRRWNLIAETARQTKAWRFASTKDRLTVTTAITEQALAGSVRLTPPDLEPIPAAFLRADGTSIFRPKDSAVFTSQALLDAEARLLDRANTRTAPTIDLPTVGHAVTAGRDGTSRGARTRGKARRVSVEQVEAVARIGASGRQIDLLVGPAGAGKTTTMRTLRTAWEREHGRGSVVGLAPSAAAAEVLAGDLGIECENTAKWLYDHLDGHAHFQAGQLIIIDEATLAGTLALNRITAHAARVGAKVLLVGDPSQLQAVEAGGAFALLAAERASDDDVPELSEVHRFVNDWEKRASLALRHGRTEAIGAYLAHDGDTDDIIETAYGAWQHDLAQGNASVLVAADGETVRALNERARAERLQTGATDPGRAIRLADGLEASAGDVVITRHNDRRLRTRGGDWVRNGDRWTVAKVRHDGSVVVRQPGARYGRTVTLPADYVAEHLDLGYAITTHRTQGVTVDTAHLLAAPGMTREHLYVGLTRGRETNTVYVATDTGADITPDDYQVPTARTILTSIINASGVEKAATQTRRDERERYGSIAQFAAEYETLAAAAQRDRWTRLLHDSGLTPDDIDRVVTAPAFGALTAELRRAEADGHIVEVVLPAVVGKRSLADAEDPAAVLHHRLAHATARPRRSNGLMPRLTPQPRRIAGLVPQATGPMAAEYEKALLERERRIEERADRLVARAQRDGEPWLTELGPQPTGHRRYVWRSAARTIAAYRDRYAITSDAPLGIEPATSEAQVADATRAAAALHNARPPQPMPSAPWHDAGNEPAPGIDL